MRITNNMAMQSTLYNLNTALSRMRDSQTDLATGRVIRKMSDDPSRASAAMTIRQDLRRAEQRSRTADDTQTKLEIADSALVSGLELMAKAKELAVRASNTGLTDTTSRIAISREIGGLRDSLLAVANTEHLDRSVFNGTAAGNAYDPSTGAYLGNDATVSRDVAPGTTIVANMTGEQIFGSQSSPSGDLFAVLDRLASAAEAGDDTAIATEHSNLDLAATRMGSAAAEIGARAARLEGIRTRATADEASMREILSKLEDTDLAEAIITSSSNETAYNTALQAAAKVLPPSLLDFLR